MSQSYSEEAQTSLPAPSFPQAQSGVLNLKALGADAVSVCMQGYVERNVGDRLTVRWSRNGAEVVRRYVHLADPTRDGRNAQYEARIWPLWALLPGDYEVDYSVTSRTGNVSRSAPAQIAVTGTPAVPTVITGGVIQTSLFGMHQPGLVATWIAPGTYTVASADDVLVQSLADFSAEGASTANVTLQLYRNHDARAFASIVSDSAGKTWTVSVPQATSLARGDLISIQLEGVRDSKIFLAVAV